ncbi:uncharacterized protein LOC135071211 isoform X2 [Ostrinia nubilalis]|uniref:uncharacterized protein LOC135071211 isoform X2 n=1 Tax=Ostrinia nubilalis TaxID=29057 RepID=UPI0030826BC5
MTGEHHRNCSCPDCLQSIGLDQMSTQHLEAKGSRIDKLYYGKYLPMRERKLIDKLIKTRAVYDGVRNEILSGNETNVINETRHGKHREMDDGDKRHKHSGIRTIVDLVDRGEMEPDPRNPNKPYLKPKDQLTDCQNCCSCSTQVGPHKNADLINYPQTKPVNKIQTSSSSRLYTKRKQAVNKKHSRLHSKKFNKEIDSIPTTIESKAIKAKRCVCECNIVRKPNKSLQRLKNAKEKVTRSIKGSISKIENTIRVKRDSIIMFRNKLRRKRALKKYECEPSYCIPEECAPPKCYEKIKTRLNDIKSDIKRSYHDLRAIGSGISFRKAPKYEIEPFCDPEACEPPKCYEKFKTQLNDMKSNIKRSFHDLRAIGSGISFKRSKKEELEPYYCLPEDCDPPKCYEKIKMRLNDIKSDIKKSYHDLRVIGSGISFKRTPKKEKAASKRKSKPVICTCEPEAEPAVPTENYENEKSIWSRKRKTSPSVKRNGLVINIEPSVLSKKKTTKPKSPRNVCECDKEEQSKTPVSPTYELGRYTFPSTDRKFPRECEASMCIPGECDYRKCAEILKAQSQTSSTHISQKSVGSGTMKHKQQSQSIDYVNEQHTKSENIEPKRQVVRIASNFSFSIEFYKDQKNEITELDKPQQETIRKFRSRNKKTGSRKTKITYPRKIRSRNKSIQSNLKRLCCIPTFHALRRCFCTLQLKDAATLEKSTVGDQIEKTTTISDCACEPKPKKSTQTKKKPFPCDPYFDRGENCDSAICEKRVRDKQEQTKNKRSGLKERKRKHCIGTTSPQLTTKTCASQCNIFSKLSSKSSDPRSKKMKFSQNELPKRTEYHNGIDDTTNRSVVRIGSSFSFNIEFYKETEPSFDATPLKNDENFEHSDYTSKHQMRQKCLRTAKCRHKSAQSKLNLSDGFRSMASQSSFTQKDQEINSNKAVKKKPVKKVSKTVCECDITTQTSASGAYVRPPILPQYYTRGQCNDLTCVKKIDSQSHTTNECRHRKINTVCCSKSRSRSIKTLTDTGSSKRQMSRETKMLKSLSSKDFATGQDTSHHRQSVNIGSSFSFNIEFSKDTSSTKQHNIVANKVTNNHVKQKCKECVCKAIDAPSLRQPQICKNNERKEYGIKPFFDKCFCTLKQLKARKDTIRVSSPKTQSNINTKDMKSRTCQCKMKKCFYQSLQKTKQTCSYSCTNTRAYKSTSSGTSKSYIKNQKLQAKMILRPESVGDKRSSVTTDLSKNLYRDLQPVSNKQVVRLGSSFSFNIEFYKEKGDAPDYNLINPMPKNQQRKINRIGNKICDFRKTSQNHKICKKRNIMNNENTTGDMLPCSDIKTCKLKRNKITQHKPCTPKTKNKSISVKESRKSHLKRIMVTCKCEKGTATRRKSYRQVARKTSCVACGPEKMVSEIIGTDIQPVKCKTQKTQSNFYEPSIRTKHKKQPKSAIKAPTRQLVRINSNFSFNIEFNKQQSKPLLTKTKLKKVNPKLKDLKKSETQKNLLKKKTSMFANKNRKSNLGIMLKQCLCSLKYQKQAKTGKIRNDYEKETQLNIPQPYECRPTCEKYVMANRKQPRAKSVLEVKRQSLKTKKVQSSFTENDSSIKKICYQNMKREKPRQKHRIEKCSPNKAVRLGSAYNFDIEFCKKYAHQEQNDRGIHYKKIGRDQKELNFNCRRKDEASKKLNDKRLCGSCFHRHTEYQVGYIMKEEVTTVRERAFQQQHQIYYMRISDQIVKKSAQLVNPVFIQSNPFRRKYTRFNLRNKGKKKPKQRKKQVRFAISNIETKVNDKCSCKLFNKKKKFMSEIYNTHVYDSCECLQSKRPFLRSRKKSIVILYPEKNLPSNTFSSFTKMHKEGLNLQPMQSKQKTNRMNKIITHRKKHKFKATQTKENCLNKSTSCKCYINRLKKKAKDSVDNASHCTTSMTYKKEQCSLQNKRGKRKKGRKIGPNPQKMQQVSQMKKVNIQNLSQIRKERAQSKDQEDEKLDEQCTKSKANEATVKRSRIIRCIMRFSFLSKKKRFDGNQATHTRDINFVNNLKPNPPICSNEKCETAMIETIMPYCKKKFVKKCSRTCLSKECKLLIKSTAKKYTKDSKIGSKNPLFSKLSQRLSRKTSDCNEVCLKKAKTNLLKNSTPSQRLTKSFIKKYVPRNTENVKHIHDTLEMNEGALDTDGVAMKRPCCVCLTKQYSDTNKLTFETQIPKRTNLDKPKNINRTKVNADIANTIISCSCGSKICKKQSKTRSPNVSKESNVVCLCHHECQCPAILKKMEDSKKAKELKQKTKRLKQKQKMQRKKQKSNRKNKVNSDLLQLYSETSDTRLVADSCLDLTKMSAEIMWNLMKVPFKVISNPKDSFENFKMALRHPTDIKCPDGVTTKAIGIKQKFAAMRMTKNAKDMLESFTVTNYLIHAFDDDSTKRLRALKSRKQMKKREREDFGCSPFMASLRKRPFLWVYDKCPSFYPQFISLLSGWRQFIDMLLFLSAIVVWSPCIFGIELCRAIMCCCLCTG